MQAGKAGRLCYLSWAKTKLSRTNKKSSLSRKPLSLTRLLSTTTQVNKKSNNYISKLHAKSKCNRSFFHQFVFSRQILLKLLYINETFLRYSKQNKQPNKNKKAENHGEQIQQKQKQINYKTVKNKNKSENHKPNIWGKTRGKLTFCVRNLEKNKTKANIKTICIIKQKQLIVTRMCNDWLVDEYVPFHWREK